MQVHIIAGTQCMQEYIIGRYLLQVGNSWRQDSANSNPYRYGESQSLSPSRLITQKISPLMNISSRRITPPTVSQGTILQRTLAYFVSAQTSMVKTRQTDRWPHLGTGNFLQQTRHRVWRGWWCHIGGVCGAVHMPCWMQNSTKRWLRG